MNGSSSVDMLLSALVTLLTIVLFFYMGFRVGQMRGKHNIKAPAMTGNDEFERAVRVHMNSMEGAIVFLPALWVATIWFGGYIPAITGAVWIIGRVVYMQGYMAAPEKRSTGFGIQALALLVLLVLGFWGVIQTLVTSG